MEFILSGAGWGLSVITPSWALACSYYLIRVPCDSNSRLLLVASSPLSLPPSLLYHHPTINSQYSSSLWLGRQLDPFPLLLLHNLGLGRDSALDTFPEASASMTPGLTCFDAGSETCFTHLAPRGRRCLSAEDILLPVPHPAASSAAVVLVLWELNLQRKWLLFNKILQGVQINRSAAFKWCHSALQVGR